MSKSKTVKDKKAIDVRGRRKVRRGTQLKSRRQTLSSRGPAKLGGFNEEAVGKLACLIAMLRRPKGATMEQMTLATGWQAHSVRGAISGALKKRRGFAVASNAESGSARVYRIG